MGRRILIISLVALQIIFQIVIAINLQLAPIIVPNVIEDKENQNPEFIRNRGGK